MRVTLVVLASVAAAAPAAASAAPTPVRVFLERGGQTVTARSGDEVAIPRFGGGDRAWTQLVGCVRERFAPFQVEIGDRRPASGDYITALVGGRASMIGLPDRTTNGIGPYSGEVIPNAIVHVFSQVGTGEGDVDNLCAVTAHEVGHSLGLDHSNVCGDLMSYHNDECGTQQFLDVDGPCGELSDRDCATGDATQNSYQRLAALVGLRAGAPRTGPKARGASPALDDTELDEPDGEVDTGDDGAWTDDSADGAWADDGGADDASENAASGDEAPADAGADGADDAWTDDADEELDDAATDDAWTGGAIDDAATDDARHDGAAGEQGDVQPRAPRWRGRGWQRGALERPRCGG